MSTNFLFSKVCLVQYLIVVLGLGVQGNSSLEMLVLLSKTQKSLFQVRLLFLNFTSSLYIIIDQSHEGQKLYFLHILHKF